MRGFKYEQLNIVIDEAAHAVNACPSRMDPAVSQVQVQHGFQEAEIHKVLIIFDTLILSEGTINFVDPCPRIYRKIKKGGGRISSGYESNGNVLEMNYFLDFHTKKLFGIYSVGYQKGILLQETETVNEVRSAFRRYNMGTKGNFKMESTKM